MENTGAAIVRTTSGFHGEDRGLSLSRRSSQFEGRFGRMFRCLPAAKFDEKMLKDLAKEMTAKAEDDPTPEEEADDEENPAIPAGYTYLGQFIDHDLTFDPVSSLQRQNDPDGLVNFRTPRFDLDCVYGRGPTDQAYLYRKDGVRMLLGEALTGNADDPGARDLPRIRSMDGEPARAVIGDPRNDENVIISQMQSAMIRFHNVMADLTNSNDFEKVQRLVRWHYQWIVLYDFLPTIIGKDMFQEIMGEIQDEGETPTAKPPQLRHYKIEKSAFMPVEFSVAAYRFGHSMIRPLYRLSSTVPGAEGQRIPILDPEKESLVGFRKFPSQWAIDWRLFFPIEDAPATGPKRVQPSYKIDTSLVNPLARLPESQLSDRPSLAERNLVRGWRMQLPSGQAVAQAMRIKPICDKDLRVGKANEDSIKTNKLLTDISPAFADNAPLWFYILAEAQQQFVNNETHIHLGPVGGRIVGEVMLGLLLADSHSFLRQNPGFRPKEELARKGKFKMADLLSAVMTRSKA